MDFCMASYIKILKKYLLNINMSNEDFVNALFYTLNGPADVKDKNNEPLYLDKSRVSKLLSRKEDIPSAMRAALSIYGINDKIIEAFEDFVEDYVNYQNIQNTVDEISAMIPDKFALLTLQTKPELFLAKVFIEAIKTCNIAPPIKNPELWKKGKNSVEVICGDIFKFAFCNRCKTQKNIVVIPVNTAFDTHITTHLENESIPLVSDTTIHGQWLSRIIKDRETENKLYNRIIQNLKNQGYIPINTAKQPNGRSECYPIGTVAIIDMEKVVFYLLAISAFDEYNNAHSTENDIKTAIIKLLETYNHNGQGYTMYLPLLGTGRSRARLSHQESFDLIKDTLLANEALIQGKICIVIEPNTYNQIKI